MDLGYERDWEYKTNAIKHPMTPLMRMNTRKSNADQVILVIPCFHKS